MKLKEAIFVALGELGDRTSLKHLQTRVEELTGKLPNYRYTCNARRLWRKDIAGGLKTDARKHADIMITKDSVLIMTQKWMFGSGPQENFEEWVGRLALTGSGIGGYPPFEELYDFEKDHLR